MASKLFAFSRPLPAPFSGTRSKKVAVSSKYGDGTEATLTATVLKGVLAYCGCKTGAEEGAVGQLGQKGVAEYKSKAGPDAFHLAVYDPSSGSVLASVYDKNTEMMETYACNTSGKDGAAIVLAMLPTLMEDDEFHDTLDAFEKEYIAGFPDKDEARKLGGILCDNAYRRVEDSKCPAHLKVSIDNSGNVMRVSQTHLDSGSFTPDRVTAGEFTIFAQTGPAQILQPGAAMDHSDFVAKFVLDPTRELSMAERAMVPTLEPWYVIPEQVVNVCKHARLSTGKARPMRNFLLRGPAGTGKTEGAKAIAAGLNLPYLKYTCSANTEVYDFIGQVFPETDGPSTGDPDLDRERQELKAMGGINYENVKKLMGLPDLDDMDYDPEGVYLKLTGIARPGTTSQDCMGKVLELVTDKLQKLCKVKPETVAAGQTYTYVETDFIRALKHGYVLELQEPKQNLLDRGLTEEAIFKFQYRTTPLVGHETIAKTLVLEGLELYGVPGFYRGENGRWTMHFPLRGIMIPCRDREGRIQSLHIRLDKKMKRGGKFLTFSTPEQLDGAAAENWCHVVGPVRESILLIEGYMKADIVHHFTGQTVIAIPGVTSIRHLKLVLDELIALGVRHVMTCFDMDYLKNWHVDEANRNLTLMLGCLPITFGTYLWVPDYNGLDDYIWEFCLERRQPQS